MTSVNPRYANGYQRRKTVRWLKHQCRPCWVCRLPIDYELPRQSRYAFQCDELIPVSRGGSPYEHDNVEATHACCNNWRKTKSVEEVNIIRSLVRKRFASWQTPTQFINYAKALKRAPLRAGIQTKCKKRCENKLKW